MSDLLKNNNITASQLGTLLFIKLNTTGSDYVREVITNNLYEYTDNGILLQDYFEEKGWIKYIKTGKKDLVNRIRLSDKGEEIVKSLSQKPPHELSGNCWKILEEEYKRFEIDKSKIYNKSKTTHYISEWLYCKEEEGKMYNERMFRALIVAYLGTFEYEKKIYVPKTLNLLFKSENAYASKFTKDASPLYQFSNLSSELVRKTYNKLASVN